VTSEARHTFVAHTAELALRIVAPSVEALLAEACRALGSLLVEEAGDAGVAGTRTLEIRSVDRDALLIDLLNEIIFVAETERWAPRDAVVERCEEESLTVRLAGTALRAAPSRIKSATHHGSAVRAMGQTVTADVVFDV
jgi:SHS2 domain-containing protein